jgi:hypothetical protein
MGDAGTETGLAAAAAPLQRVCQQLSCLHLGDANCAVGLSPDDGVRVGVAADADLDEVIHARHLSSAQQADSSGEAGRAELRLRLLLGSLQSDHLRPLQRRLEHVESIHACSALNARAVIHHQLTEEK